MPTPTTGPISVLLKIGVSIAIVIMFGLFVLVGTNTFFPMPDYAKICPVDVYSKAPPATAEVCIAEGGSWQAMPAEVTVVQGDPGGFCDMFAKCQQQFDAQQKDYAPRAYGVMVGAAVIGVVVSLFIAVEAISLGLLVGGVVIMLGSTGMFWGQVNDYLRFGVIAAVFVFLLAVAWLKTSESGRAFHARLKRGKSPQQPS